MMQGLSIPLAADDPVAVALNDPAIRTGLWNAARAFLGKRAAELTPIQRTAEAEVIAQEAASRAWQHRDRFDSSKDVVKWLVGFVINVAREFAKKRGSKMSAQRQDDPGPELLITDPARPVEDTVTDKLFVGQLLEQLPSTDQRIVQMKYWQEMTCAEIGQHIGMNENAVRVRLFRIILKLKQVCGVTGEGQP